jgi:signal peptidase I
LGFTAPAALKNYSIRTIFHNVVLLIARKVHELRKITRILFWSFVTWLVVRTFLFQSYRIPSSSMHGTLYEGDYILVNKMAYGARLPITPLSFGGHHLDWLHLPYLRLFGYSKVKRNDVIVFNYPVYEEGAIDIQEEYIKRCVALPGDTVSIINGVVFVNGYKEKEPRTIYHHYLVESKTAIDPAVLTRLNIPEGTRLDSGQYSFFMSINQADSLEYQKNILAVRPDVMMKNSYHPSIFPNYPVVQWNLDFFGPLWVPGSGDSILLDQINLSLYQRLIEKHEGVTLTLKGDSVFINDFYSTHYTFKQNYYFVLGDNRYNSKDSRYWGFVPESHIIGKASMVLFSGQKSGRNLLNIE